MWRDNYGVWKSIAHKKYGSDGGTNIAYYLRTFERKIFYGRFENGILNADSELKRDVIMADIKDVLMKVAADTDKYRDLVTGLADKE